MTRADELTLVRRARTGELTDSDIKSQVLPLARAVARRTGIRGDLLEDLQQVAAVAILHAATRWNESEGTRFSAYAWKAAARDVSRASFALRAPVGGGHHHGRRVQKVRAVEARLRTESDEHPTIAEIAEAADESVETTTTLLAALEGSVPLDDLLCVADWRDDTDSIIDRAGVHKLLRCLGAEDRTIIAVRFGLDGKGERSIREIARLIGRSPGWVHLRIGAALRQLRSADNADADDEAA